MIEWTIRSDGVGTIRIGEKLDAALLPTDLAGRYLARFVADAQPFEGFRLDTPPATVAVRGGPLSKQLETDGTSEPNADALRGKAGAAVAGGVTVSAILVSGPAPRTAAGVGVGSNLDALKTAYADLNLHPVPPTLGKDECVAESAALPNVRFIFSSCDAAKSGEAVQRVDVWPLDS